MTALIQLYTNVADRLIPSGFEQQLTEFVAKTTNRTSEKWVTAVHTDTDVYIDGDDVSGVRPAVSMVVMAPRRAFADQEKNDAFSALINGLIEKILGVERERFSILYGNFEDHDIAKP